jgi:hypothetical protein
VGAGSREMRHLKLSTIPNIPARNHHVLEAAAPLRLGLGGSCRLKPWHSDPRAARDRFTIPEPPRVHWLYPVVEELSLPSFRARTYRTLHSYQATEVSRAPPTQRYFLVVPSGWKLAVIWSLTSTVPIFAVITNSPVRYTTLKGSRSPSSFGQVDSLLCR